MRHPQRRGRRRAAHGAVGAVAVAVMMVATLCAGAERELGPGKYELFDYNPVANPKAVVVSGSARFTVLTPRVIRCEYAGSSGGFNDSPTAAFIHRNTTVPAFTSSTTGGVLTITTDYLVLSYTVGASFSGSTLSIRSAHSNASSTAPASSSSTTFAQRRDHWAYAGAPAAPSAAFETWHFGDEPEGNLLGTIKSLDLLTTISLNCTDIANVRVHDESLHCRWGLVSTQGWAAVDDSPNYLLTKDLEWWTPDATQNPDAEDTYFFGHGEDYLGALADFTQIAGVIPMAPRFAAGIFRTRWYDYSARDILEVVQDYVDRSLPLDVVISDMDWHVKGGPNGQPPNVWGAYSWDKRLFPSPAAFGKALTDKGLMLMLNIHDDNGIMAYEDTYAAAAAALGVSDGSNIPFNIVNVTYAHVLDDIVLAAAFEVTGPMPYGIDTGLASAGAYSWTDFQQGGTQGNAPGGYYTPQMATSKLRGTDYMRRGANQRDFALSRWGGLGNHRYGQGFSGDVSLVDWTDLAFQPYFSLTASNVGFGFWSHDLVGPPSTSDENRAMHSRWLQWGAFSAVFRTHDRGMSAGVCANSYPDECFIVEVWNTHKENYKINRAAMIARTELVPYTYTAYRAAYETGVSLLRPMYYYYPSLPLAYATTPTGAFAQYFFGPDMIVAPVVFPADPASGLTPKSVFIPPGQWFEVDTGVLHTGVEDGSTVLTKAYPLHEVPRFVRGSAILPKIPFSPAQPLANALRPYNTLVLQVYPPLVASASTVVYEDDGMTLDYVRTGKYVMTRVAYTSSATGGTTTLKLTVTPQPGPGGPHSNFPAQRDYEVHIVAGMPFVSGTANGAALDASAASYDGDHVTLKVKTPALATNAPATIVLEFETPDMQLLSGAKGMIVHGLHAKKKLDETRVTPGAHSSLDGSMMALASTGYELELAAASSVDFMTTLKSLSSRFAAARSELDAVMPALPKYPLTQLYDSSRQDNVLCAPGGCMTDNSYYKTMRVEGYGVPPGTPGSVPLLDFWNAAANDNADTPAAAGPVGADLGAYAPAAFSANGYILSSQADGTVPLKLYYSSSRQDYMSVASQAGIQYAQDNGYTLMDPALGYVYTSPPGSGSSSIAPSRWIYASSLLHSAAATAA